VATLILSPRHLRLCCAWYDVVALSLRCRCVSCSLVSRWRSPAARFLTGLRRSRETRAGTGAHYSDASDRKPDQLGIGATSLAAACFIGRRLRTSSRYSSRPGTRFYRGWASGLSSSIALVVADAGQPGKHYRAADGPGAGFRRRSLTWWNIVPTILIIASLIPLYWWMMPPAPGNAQGESRLLARDDAGEAETPNTPAGKLERAAEFDHAGPSLRISAADRGVRRSRLTSTSSSRLCSIGLILY